MDGSLFSPKITVPFPSQVTDIFFLETIVTGSGDRLASCSVNKGAFACCTGAST